MSYYRCIWKKGNKKVTGGYSYNWAGDYFNITLDSKDVITGRIREFRIYGEEPNFNGFKLIEKDGKIV